MKFYISHLLEGDGVENPLSPCNSKKVSLVTIR